MDEPGATHESPESKRSARHLTRSQLAIAMLFGGGLLASFTLRAAAHWFVGDPTSDPDAYVSIAANLRETSTFATYGSATPSAFRPPLYPFLGGVLPVEEDSAPVDDWIPVARRVLVGLSLLAAMTTYILALFAAVLIYNQGERWQPTATATVWLLIIGSPLGVIYAVQPMTESSCEALLLAATVFAAAFARSGGLMPATGLGLACGLACLCRPTCFVPAAGWGAWLLWRAWRRNDRPIPWAAFATAAVVGVATLSPWAVRNYRVFGRPIVTTTHGGYTLLLGNNDAFYDEVVRRPWGTVWSGEQLAAWSDGLQAEMAAAGVKGELARDAYQKAKAVETIRRRPGDFLRACVLRVARLWNVVPQGPAAERLPWWAYGGVGGFYCLAWALAGVGAWEAWRRRLGLMVAAAIPPLAFTAVHAVYWSNARMRLPVEPCVFLFAGLGAEAVWRWAGFGESRPSGISADGEPAAEVGTDS